MKLKLKQNRKLILRLLDEDYDENYPPPHSVSTLHYILKNIAQYNWKGYPDSQCPDIRNINRTCNDLLNAGYLVVSRVLTEPLEQGHLHYWEKHYQLSISVERNWISKECSIIHHTLKTAMFGHSFFGGDPFDVGLPKAFR